MRPEYYADLFRRYASFCRDFGDNKLIRVACGPGGLNQSWTRVVMDRAADQMQAYSLHFYTVWPEWQQQNARHRLRRKRVVRHAPRMPATWNARSTRPKKIMDRVDPKKRIELFVDEWGSWYRVEPGHPGYGLYQQNSLRDAVLAGLTFHIFHEHNDRVKMANIAQVVNVLQAMILTDDEQMLLTPTYQVFEMYKVHQDATRLPVRARLARLRVRRPEDPGPQRLRLARQDRAWSTSRSSTPTPPQPVKLDCELQGRRGVAGRRPHPHGRQARRPQHVRRTGHGEAHDVRRRETRRRKPHRRNPAPLRRGAHPVAIANESPLTATRSRDLRGAAERVLHRDAEPSSAGRSEASRARHIAATAGRGSSGLSPTPIGNR